MKPLLLATALLFSTPVWAAGSYGYEPSASKLINDAKKLINTMIRKQKQNLGYKVDRVIVLDKDGNKREASKNHLEIIKKINMSVQLKS